jgi:phage terminase large subunit-like protein
MGYKTDFTKIDLDKYYFDEVVAQLAVDYIEENVKHVEGELGGEPFILEEWQKNEIIKPLFGWKHKSTGLRKYKNFFGEVPKKSGKSFIAASVATIFLDIEREAGSKIIGAGWGKKQAGLIFEVVKGIVKQSPRLKSKCKIYRNSITAPDHIGGIKTYQTISKEAGAEDGFNPQLAIIDELHVHKNNEIIEVAEKSMVRPQSLCFVITTAGSDLYGIGFQRHEYAINVTKGILIDETMLVCIHGADKDDDPYDEQTWIKANPNYGISVPKEKYQEEANRARSSSASLNSFKRYYLNIWTSSVDGWINDEVWQASQWEFDESLLLDEPCYAGLDLSSTSDITAFTLVWNIDGKYYSKNWFFLPEEKGKNSADKNNIQYVEWLKNGDIIETSGNTVDDDEVLFEISKLCDKYKIIMMAYDNYRSHHLVPKFDAMGLNCINFKQNFEQMTAPTLELQKSIEAKEYNHFGNPILRWMAGNATIVTGLGGSAAKIQKEKNRPEKKVDGIITNVMAFGLWLNQPEIVTSYYSDPNFKA